MKKTPTEVEEYNDKILKLRQTELGAAFYKQAELLWNAAHLEHQPGVTATQLGHAYDMHNQALRRLLTLMMEAEGIE